MANNISDLPHALAHSDELIRLLDVRLDVTNLFDELYKQSYGLPREGRAAVLTVRVR